MEERDLALPFEVKDIHESFIKKLAKKTQIVVKNTIISYNILRRKRGKI